MREAELLFIEANRAIDDKDLSEAKNILEEILSLEPSYGRAHNHLAWIYETEFRDYTKACFHYKLAIKFSGKEYPVSYINYMYLLLDMEEYKTLDHLLIEAKNIKGIKSSIILYQESRILEAQEKYIETYRLYKKAKKESFDNGFIQIINGEMSRVYDKMTVLQKLYTKCFL